MPLQTPSNHEVRNLAKKPKPSVVATPCLWNHLWRAECTKFDGFEKPFGN